MVGFASGLEFSRQARQLLPMSNRLDCLFVDVPTGRGS